jgi:tRNA A37 threonylcarbamoyladenosine modification protein TsaB
VSTSTFFVDLASHHGSFAIVSNEKTLAFQSVGHRCNDADLVPIFESLLKVSSITSKDLTHLACVVGPGGFTSLRSAVAFINTLSFVLRLPIASIHLSDWIAARVGTSFTWLHSTKKELVFLRSISDHKEPTLVELMNLPSHLKEGDTWAGELLPDQRTLVDGLGCAEASLTSLEETLPEFLKAQKYLHELVAPWYGRGW